MDALVLGKVNSQSPRSDWQPVSQYVVLSPQNLFLEQHGPQILSGQTNPVSAPQLPVVETFDDWGSAFSKIVLASYVALAGGIATSHNAYGIGTRGPRIRLTIQL